MSSGFAYYKVTEQQQDIPNEYVSIQQRPQQVFSDYRVQINGTQEYSTNDQAQFQKILEAKEREIVNLRESVKSLNNQITDYLNELDQWKMKYKQLQAEKGTSTGSIAINNSWEINSLKEEIRKLRQENNDLKIMPSASNNDVEIFQLRSQIKQLKEDLITNTNKQDNNQEITKLQIQIRQLISEKDDAIRAKNLIQQQSVARTTISQDTEFVKSLTNDRDELKRNIKVLENKIQEQQQEIQRLNYNCDQYIQEIQQSQMRFSNNKTSTLEIDGYLRRISALQHEVLQWQDRCRALELSTENDNQLSQKDNQIFFLQEKIKQYEIQIEQLRVEIDKSRKEIDGYRISFESRKSDVNEVEILRRKVAEMEQDIQILIADLQEREQRISATQNEYEEQIRIMQNQGQLQYETELTLLKNEREKYRQDYERISNDYLVLQRQSNNTFEIDSLKQRIIELESQLRGSQSQYSSLQQQYQQVSSQFQQLQNSYQQLQQSQIQSQETIRIQQQYGSLQSNYQQLQQQFNLQQGELENLRQSCSRYKQDYESIKIELTQIKQEKISIQKSSQFINNDYQALQDRYNQSLNEISSLTQQLRKYKTDYDSLNTQYISFQRESETRVQVNNTRELELLRNQYEQQIKQLKIQIQQFQDNEQQLMERLRVERFQIEQSITQKFQSQQSNELISLKNQYEQLQQQFQSCQMELKMAKDQATRQSTYETQNLNQQLEQLRQINLQLNQEIKNLQEQNSKYKIEYETINQRVLILQNNRGDSDKLTARIREQDFEIQQYNQMIQKLQNDLQNQSQTIKSDLEQQFISRLTIERQNLEMKLQQQGSIELQSVQMSLNQSRNELSNLKQQYSQLEIQFNSLKNENQNLKQQMITIQKQSQTISNDQVKKYTIKISELEHEIQTQKIDIAREKNLNSEQLGKIQTLITKITEYESRLHILEQENTRLENKIKKTNYEKGTDFQIVNQLIGGASQNIVKKEIITTTSGINQIQNNQSQYGLSNQFVTATYQTNNYNSGKLMQGKQSGFNEYQLQYDQRIQSQNEIRQSQFSQRIQSPQPQVQQYLSPDKQPSKMATTKSVKQAIMFSGQ